MQDRFPGWLEYGGIIAIHADWPMYPSGIGWQVSLLALGSFPYGTNFYEIDDIDGCKLLINQDPRKVKDPFDLKYYQVATWHEDLIELKARGLISGVALKSSYEFHLIQFENFKRDLGENLREDEEGNIILHTKDKEGNLKRLNITDPNLMKMKRKRVWLLSLTASV